VYKYEIVQLIFILSKNYLERSDILVTHIIWACIRYSFSHNTYFAVDMTSLLECRQSRMNIVAGDPKQNKTVNLKIVLNLINK